MMTEVISLGPGIIALPHWKTCYVGERSHLFDGQYRTCFLTLWMAQPKKQKKMYSMEISDN